MGKMATKKATAQLQKLFNFLGEFGGVIETNQPGTWWTLDLEVEEIDGDKKTIMVGVYTFDVGDFICDPMFHASLTMKDGKIEQVEILKYESTTLLGTICIDDNDMLRGFGMQEKDELGLKKRFSSFMDTITKDGPYLREPKSVKRYSETLA